MAAMGICTTYIICCCCCLVAKMYPTLLWPHQPELARLLCPWNFPDKNTGVGCHFHLQGISLDQGLNPHLLHWHAILYHWAIREAHSCNLPGCLRPLWLKSLLLSWGMGTSGSGRSLQFLRLQCPVLTILILGGVRNGNASLAINTLYTP